MRILVFGDSNSWGYLDDGSGQRYHLRWPVSMARKLKLSIPQLELIEDCLPGRTTDLADPVMGEEFNGKAALLASLKAHQPLDYVLLMLGTNDFKKRFARTAENIGNAIDGLIGLAAKSGAGPDGWHAPTPPHIIVISPAILGNRANDPSWERCKEWEGGRAESLRLSGVLSEICVAKNVGFVDSNQIVESSSLDPIHWADKTHQHFGEFMADRMTSFFAVK